MGGILRPNDEAVDPSSLEVEMTGGIQGEDSDFSNPVGEDEENEGDDFDVVGRGARSSSAHV